jgi:outer membrane beta-barrel protein
MRIWIPCLVLLLAAASRAEDGSGDTVTAVQKRPLRQAHRLELQPYGEMSIADPYLQRWGAGLRAMWHLREGLSIGLDGNGLGSWATEELVIAKTELHARIVESRARMTLGAFAAIAPLYGKVALPGDALVHFETFLDAGLGAAWTETDATRGVRPMIAAGIGQRVFLGEDLALTARVGGNLYAEKVVVDGARETKAMGFWTLRLGLAWYFGGGQ